MADDLPLRPRMVPTDRDCPPGALRGAVQHLLDLATGHTTERADGLTEGAAWAVVAEFQRDVETMTMEDSG